MSSSAPVVRRVWLSRDHIAELDKEQLVAKWYEQEAYINQLEFTAEDLSRQLDILQHDLKTNEARFEKRLQDTCMKLSLRERKMTQLQDKLVEIKKQKRIVHPLECSLVDPAVNLMFEKMRIEVEASRAKVEEMQNEISAWRFTPDSAIGERLMAKCRMLHNENEDLGRRMSGGWTAQLNGNLALQKKFSEEMKNSQMELDDFLSEIEGDMEGIQDTIYHLQQRQAGADEAQNSLKGQQDKVQQD